MKNKIVKSNSEQQTIKLAEKIAAQLEGGCVLGLVGELGTGKTHFVKGLAQGFGIGSPITSPTFVLLKEYRVNNKQKTISNKQRKAKSTITRYPLPVTKFVHIDCYRLSSAEELLELGLEEYMKDPRVVLAIEWADKIKKILPKDTIWAYFKMVDKGGGRKISIKLA